MMQILRAAVCACCTLICCAATAAAQTAAQLSGVVRDETGRVMRGVDVTVSGAALASPITVTTDDQGSFRIDTAPGRYQVRADFAGFDGWREDVVVSASGARLDVNLRVRALSDQVTVTATRLSTADIQTTPIAITALPAQTLEEREVERIEHLVGLVPTLRVSETPGGLPLLTLRGIGSNDAANGADPSVTMQLDGVYLARTSMALDFLDVERIEVLRGPQGTLVGRNSIGGTINVVTSQPTNALEMRTRLTAGAYDKFRVEGAISGPIVRNRIMGSVAFLRGSRDGFVTDLEHPDNPLGGEDTWAGRGQLRLVFNARSELLLSADYSRNSGVPLTIARPLVAKPGAPPFDIPADFWSVRANEAAEGRNSQAGTSARLSLGFGDAMTFTSLTAYRDGDARLFVDSDTTELALGSAETSEQQRQISQEVTVARVTSKLTWLGGAYWFDEHAPGSLALSIFRPLPLPFPIQFRGRSIVDERSWALFGQTTYRLSDRLSLTGGLRYSSESEQAHITNGTYRLTTSTPLGPISDFVDRTSEDAWTPKAVLEVRASADTFAYFSVTRGFKSGGINITATGPGGAFRPEFAWSYETGVKQTLMGGRGRLNASLFYVDHRDLQVHSFVSPGVIDISNAGKATSKGLEVEGTVSVWRGVQFAGLICWLDAKYDKYEAIERPAFGQAAVRVDASGNRLLNAPEWSGAGSVEHAFQTGSAGKLLLHGDVSWQSRAFFTPSNVPVQSQGSYGLVHARASFAPRNGRWELAAYVRNIGRQEYVTVTWDATADAAISGRPGEPRQWGTQFTIRR